jgi:hypothetical protein
MFAPVATGNSAKAGKPGFGRLNADGSFVVSTYGNEDGVVVGKHWVTIMRDVQISNPDAPSAGTTSSMPFERYAIPEQKSAVAGQENVINIELTSAMLSQ